MNEARARDLILGAINGGCQSAAQLAGLLLGHGAAQLDAYTYVHSIAPQLAREGLAHFHSGLDCWVVGKAADIEPREPDELPAEEKKTRKKKAPEPISESDKLIQAALKKFPNCKIYNPNAR